MSPAKKTTRRATAKKKAVRRKAAGTKAAKTKARATKKKPTKARATKKKVTKAAPVAKKKAAEAGPVAKKKAAEAGPAKTPAVSAPETVPAEDRQSERKKVARRAVVSPSPPDAHPKFGVKHICFQCGAKFYDLFRPEPLCPKCGADQRDAPKIEVLSRPLPPRKRSSKRSMAPLLDDDEDDDDEESPFDDEDESDLDLGRAGAAFDDPAADMEDEGDL